MREILFRGKRLVDGNWVEGYYVKASDSFTNDVYHIIFRTDVIALLDIDNFDGYRVVRPETVGQFTGLFDKNGKKIFEGDILSQTDKINDTTIIRAVKYEMSCGSCCSQVIGFGASGNLHTDFIRLDEPFEVIGNIYDNPELLED